MLKIINLLFRYFANSRFGRWFFNQIIGKYTFRKFGYTTFPMEDFFVIHYKMREFYEKNNGNCAFLFASCDTLSLAGFLISRLFNSKYSHAGIMLFDSNIYEKMQILHMKGNGFNKWHLLDLLKEIDNFSVIGISLTKEQAREYRRRINVLQIGSFLLRYDFAQELIQTENVWSNFEKDLIANRKIFNLYCSELCFVVLADMLNLKAKKFLGRIVFEPNDVVNLSGMNNIEKLYEKIR